VRDDDQGNAQLRREAHEQRHHLVGVDQVERGGRLVGEHDLRPVGDGARHRGPLPLAERNAGRLAAGEMRDAKELEEFRNRSGARQSEQPARDHHVLVNREKWKQSARLQHVAEVARARPRHLGPVGARPELRHVGRFAVREVQTEAPRPGRPQCHRQQVETGALAAAAGAEQRHPFAVGDREPLDL
jgi:hypothetical protein